MITMSQLRIGRVDIRMRSGSTVKGHEPVYSGDPYSEIGREVVPDGTGH